MLVKNWMSKNVITAEENDSMHDAMKLLKVHDIRMLPVMKKGKLVGIITDRDLKKASASDATTLEVHELLYLLTKIKVKDIMTKDVITVLPEFTAEETARVLLRNKISGAPVVDANGQLVGAITQAGQGSMVAKEKLDCPALLKEWEEIREDYDLKGDE